MKKKKYLTILFVSLIILGGAYFYHSSSHVSNVYKGMSVIPEKTKDIPLYKGLKPREADYVIKGNKSKELYTYYKKHLAVTGWELKNDYYYEEYDGFNQDWQKGSSLLHITSQFTIDENETYIIFDKTTAPEKLVNNYDDVCFKFEKSESCITKEESQHLEAFINQVNLDAEVSQLPKDANKEATIIIRPNEIQMELYKANDHFFYVKVNEKIIQLKPESSLLALLNTEAKK